MLDEEFEMDAASNFVLSGVSNIGDGLENLDLIPCSFRIDDFQTNMAKARRGYRSADEFYNQFSKRRSQLRSWLNQNYDFTIIDCPPALALQVRVFLIVAEHFIIPSVPDRLSVRGSLYLLDRMKSIGLKKIQPLGLLWSLYRAQNAMHGRIIEHVKNHRPPYDQLPAPFETVIPNSAAIADSTEPDQNPSSFSAKYSSRFSILFRNLSEEIIQRTNWDAPTNGTSRAVTSPADLAE